MRDIRQAVKDQLDEGGYSSITLEGIAKRAGVSKPVLYRRFSSRVLLVANVLGDVTSDIGAPESSTSLRDDLIAWLTKAHDRASALGPDTYRGVIGEADATVIARIKEIQHDTVDEMRKRAIDPAVARGELGPTPLDRQVLLAPFTILENRVMFGEDEPTIEFAVDEIVLPLFRTKSGWKPAAGS